MPAVREREARLPWLRGAVLWGLLGSFLVAMLVVIAALAFSVRVAGSSMEPTLLSGDRVVRIPGGEVERFDIVESTLADREIPVVKRVIGMPGDRIAVTIEGGVAVRVTPAGGEATYVVDNPAWPDRIGDATVPCCADDGTSLPAGQPPRVVEVPAGHYWVVGDNWGRSADSRDYGFLRAGEVHGRLTFRIFPFEAFGALRHDVQLVEERTADAVRWTDEGADRHVRH